MLKFYLAYLRGTTGVPIALLIRNADQKSKDYSHIDVFRPSCRYDIRKCTCDYRGGGRSSGRETACRKAAVVIAKKILRQHNIQCSAFTSQVGDIVGETVDLDYIEKNPVRAADPNKADEMKALIETLATEGDSIGGAVSLIITGLPVGLGDPVFDKCEAILSHALMSIGTIKGIEFGMGFNAISMKGSEHNDVFVSENDTISTQTNHAGGILGGITNGEPLMCRLAIKPPSSISKDQDTVTKDGKETNISVTGRHDPCICPRVVPVVESMSAIAILDMLLTKKLSDNFNKIFEISKPKMLIKGFCRVIRKRYPKACMLVAFFM